jgi:hypothetical protein
MVRFHCTHGNYEISQTFHFARRSRSAGVSSFQLAVTMPVSVVCELWRRSRTTASVSTYRSLLPACYSVCYRLSRSGDVGTTRRQSPQATGLPGPHRILGWVPAPRGVSGEWPHAPSPHPTRARRWDPLDPRQLGPTYVSSKAGFAVTMVVSSHGSRACVQLQTGNGLSIKHFNNQMKKKRMRTRHRFFFSFPFVLVNGHEWCTSFSTFYQIMLLNKSYADDRF